MLTMLNPTDYVLTAGTGDLRIDRKSGSAARFSHREYRLAHALGDLFEPHSRIHAVDDALPESQPLSGVVIVSPNIVLAGLCVQSEEGVNVSGLTSQSSNLAASSFPTI